jgi:subtilisin family serine protease
MRKRNVVGIASLCVLGLVIGSYPASSDLSPNAKSKLDTNLQAQLLANPDGRFPVLVFMNAKADLSGAERLASKQEKTRFVVNALKQTAQDSQGELKTFLTAQAVPFVPLYVSNTVVIHNASVSLLKALAERSDVARIKTDQPYKVMEPKPTKGKGLLRANGPEGVGSNIAYVGANRVWEEFQVRGEGIVIGAQDTGYDWDHPALIHQYRGKSEAGVNHNYHWHDAIHESIEGGSNSCGYNAAAPCDDNGHGTHTLGTALGDDGRGNQIGMAPKATWIGCRNMEEGVGRSSTYLECFEFFMAPYPLGGNPMKDGDPDKAADVLVNSWGCPKSEGCQGDEFLDALASLQKAGIMMVASAGNEGEDCSPSRTLPRITVQRFSQ